MHTFDSHPRREGPFHAIDSSRSSLSPPSHSAIRSFSYSTPISASLNGRLAKVDSGRLERFSAYLKPPPHVLQQLPLSQDSLVVPQPSASSCLKPQLPADSNNDQLDAPDDSPVTPPRVTPLLSDKLNDLHPLPAHVDILKLLAFLSREPGESTSFQIRGISGKDLKLLDDRARAGKLPGWDSNIRKSLVDDTLILHYPTLIHEIISDVFTRLAVQGKHLPSDAKPGSTLRNFGCADIPLFIGSKTPDFSIYERNPSDVRTLRFQIHPTVVFEVGYSQTITALRHAAARLIGSSLGAVQLVVIIKLSYNNSSEERELVEKVTAEFWELARLQPLDEWTGPVNSVTEIGPQKRGNKPNRFEFVLQESDKAFTRIVVKCSQVHDLMSPDSGSEDLQLSTEQPALKFYYYHLFRGPCPDNMYSTVLFSIPYSLIREVVLEHTEIQIQVDKFTKRPRESEETLDSYKENGAEIEHNQKRRKYLLGLQSNSDSENE